MSESKRIIEAAQAPDTSVTDALGRTLEIRKLSRRELMAGMRQWGAACNVTMWFSMAVAMASVRTLDGAPQPFPRTPEQVEALSAKLGDAGLEAIEQWYAAQDEPDLSGVREAAKN